MPVSSSNTINRSKSKDTKRNYSTPYSLKGRIATPTQRSSGCFTFSQSSIWSPGHRVHSSSSRTPPCNIVSQPATLGGTSTQSRVKPIPRFQPQVLHQPLASPFCSSIEQTDPSDIGQDVFTGSISLPHVGLPSVPSDAECEVESNLGAAEHIEDVAIQEKTSQLAETVIDLYYPFILAEHRPPSKIKICPDCMCSLQQWIHCLDCFGGGLCCESCILKQHSKHPFHRVKKWDDTEGCWIPSALHELGQTHQILHEDGTHCSHPGSSFQMKIMHTNGMHTLTLLRCACTIASATRRGLTPLQCLANRLYPATNHSPQQAYTFDVLELYHMCNLKAFTNVNQFCEVMCMLFSSETEPSGTMRSNFHTAVRQWRLFTRMYENGARNYKEFIENGSVEECPVCPHPGVNLPTNWQERDNAMLLNTTFIMGDGNFHMQLRASAKSLSEDPSYFGDTGFFANQKMCREYSSAASKLRSSSKEFSCVSQAGTPSRDRPSMNMCVSGIWALSCKHGWFIKNGVVDIPKGERFYLADIAFLNHVNEIWKKGLHRVVFTYDINCKYKLNLSHRSLQNIHTPLDPKFNDRLHYQAGYIAFLVNVFHQRAHNPECADEHSIRNTPNVGMTSGEDVESPWALMNYRQYSLREMGSGGRRDMLNMHLHGWNTERLEEKYWYAEGQCERLAAQFRDLVSTLNEYNPNLVPQYESDYTQRGGEQFRPDAEKVKYPTRHECLIQLRELEKENAGRSDYFVESGQSMVSLVEMGLELEIQGASLHRQEASKSTIGYLASRKRQLQNHIATHSGYVSELFATCLEEEDRIQEGEIAQASAFPCHLFKNPRVIHYGELELQVRVGHGHDLLERVRKALGLKTFLSRWQKNNARGLTISQRVSSCRARAKTTLDSWTLQYRANWTKICKLCKALKLDIKDEKMCLERLKGLQELTEDHLRMLSDWVDAYHDYQPNRRDAMPWIWKVGRYDGLQSNENERSAIEKWEEEARRLEWLHAFQSLERWKEELLLLQEELTRLGAWYKHKIEVIMERSRQVRCGNHELVDEALPALLRYQLRKLRIEASTLPRLCN